MVADVRMPGMDGIELVRELARRKIALPVVLISGHADVPMAVAGIKAGAEDFIEKPIDDRSWSPRSIAAWPALSSSRSPSKRRTRSAESFSRLTPRQVEIFDLVASGFTSQAIASKLDISIRTVESVPRADHGKDAGRERRRAGPAGDPARAHRHRRITVQSLRLPRDARRQ